MEMGMMFMSNPWSTKAFIYLNPPTLHVGCLVSSLISTFSGARSAAKEFYLGGSPWPLGWGFEENDAAYACRKCVELTLGAGHGPCSKKLNWSSSSRSLRSGFFEDAITQFCSPSRWKELSKETSSKILPHGDGSYWKTFKPVSSLIAKGKLK
nr:hypothetical protein [Tanacetum cinerariifolium]